jgi:hypothetical protein
MPSQDQYSLTTRNSGFAKAHKTLGKWFAECYTRQTTLEKKTTAKGVLPSVICRALDKDFA